MPRIKLLSSMFIHVPNPCKSTWYYLQGPTDALTCPDLFIYVLILILSDFDCLNEEDAAENNQLAFDVAEREFNIQPVTTGKEITAEGDPDKLLMVLYLSKFYEAFRDLPLNKKG